jgi:1-deoxy-D-xylulose-5-phosphate reductoisomerase
MVDIILLGATGSIGQQVLDLVRLYPQDFNIVAMSANQDMVGLQAAIHEFSPSCVAIGESENLITGLHVYKGNPGLRYLALLEADIVVNALVGSVGILPTIAALETEKRVALANKETLVAAGELVMNKAKPGQIIPVDSEHSAIYQCLQGENYDTIKNLILTCSGGPFSGYTREQLAEVTIEDALKHPTWKMGKKITVDSATLMNKGFEVIEAHYLFGVPYTNIDVKVHPQSILHSAVELHDGSIKAQLGNPDMKAPILYALTYPKRHWYPGEFEWKDMTFESPDIKSFKCLHYAYLAGNIGGTMPAALNAANEVAVQRFLDGELSFLGIERTAEYVIEHHPIIKAPDLDEILYVDREIREKVKKIK